MRSALFPLAFVACALAASAAHAAPTPESLATKAFVARQKAALNAYRGALKSAETQLGLELKAIETGLKTNPNLFAAPEATFGALRDFQADVQTAGTDAIAEQANAAKDALTSIGGPLEGHFPEVFYLSDGTPAAVFQESLTSDLAKAHARVRKRVGKIRALFAKEDFGFSFRIRAPRPIEQRAWTEQFINGSGSYQTTVDLVVAWSSVATDDDGQLRAAGAASGPDPIDAGADNGLDFMSASGLVVFADRFTTSFDGDGFSEGSWVVTAGEGPSELAIGIP